MSPKISIIVPCYNQAQYLSETLQSVYDQEFRDWECIVVNDGSSDNTADIAKQWTEKDKRFRYIYKENSGVANTRNRGIQEATGKYILPLDGDDKIETQYIKEALAIFEKKPEVKLVYSDVALFGAKEQELKTSAYCYKNMLTENQICVSGIFKKDDFLKTSGYNSNMVSGLEDWDFWLSFLNKDDVVIKLDGFHILYRIKDVSRSTMIDHAKNEELLLQMFKNHVPLYLEYLNPIRNKIEADYYKQEVQSYQISAEYKIGKVILFPVRLLQRIFRRLFSKKP